MDLSIIIPTHNESEIISHSLSKLLAYLDQHKITAEILIVDNGSTDTTRDIVHAVMEKHPQIQLLTLPLPSPGKAFSHGVAHANADWIVTLDADLSTNLDFIRDVLALKHTASAIIGSKSLGKQKRNIIRVSGSYLYIIITHLAFNLHLSDYSMSSKAFKKEDISPVISKLDSWTGFIFELCLYLNLKNKKLLQVSVDCEDYRQSHFSLVHEAYYRYKHLLGCFFLLRKKTSWINTL